jgi:hypothetical protein
LAGGRALMRYTPLQRLHQWFHLPNQYKYSPPVFTSWRPHCVNDRLKSSRTEGRNS